jgi:hypothetical protein
MNQEKTKQKSKQMSRMSITETVEYLDLLKRLEFHNVYGYIKNNQGKTFDELVEHFKEKGNEKCVKYLIDVWVNHWHSFFQSGGRIVEMRNKYYSLSPTNPQSRKRMPDINIIL